MSDGPTDAEREADARVAERTRAARASFLGVTIATLTTLAFALAGQLAKLHRPIDRPVRITALDGNDVRNAFEVWHAGAKVLVDFEPPSPDAMIAMYEAIVLGIVVIAAAALWRFSRSFVTWRRWVCRIAIVVAVLAQLVRSALHRHFTSEPSSGFTKLLAWMPWIELVPAMMALTIVVVQHRDRVFTAFGA